LILVDTSVWIDFFAGRDLGHVSRLEDAILDNEDLALCGIVLTEILQGIADDRSHRQVREYLEPLIMLPMTETVFVRAADIYRTLRKKGTTIRKTNDCLIAATALEYRCPLLHNDKDFAAIAKHLPLRLVEY
jgi:predicted nucleic acid-binding protein